MHNDVKFDQHRLVIIFEMKMKMKTSFDNDANEYLSNHMIV